ncbi:MAG: T9SS type A sorting domain-containing protein [Chitinophagales bacterium]
MRQIIFFLLIYIGMSSLQAQVTIKKSNFPRKVFIEQVYITSNADVVAPSTGPNQVWDYSGIKLGNLAEFQHIDASNDPDFPNADSYYLRSTNFQSFQIPYYSYERVDESGYYAVGAKLVDTSYPITSITGGADDMLKFTSIPRQLQGGFNYYMEFPMTYQTKWTSNYIDYIDFELTVAAFGLDQVPGFNKQYVSINSEVVGYGQLTIPMPDGSPSTPVEVLLLQSTSTRIDSFFLGGTLAPSILLNAFGVSQGQIISNDANYSFYTPDFEDLVLFVSDQEDDFYNYSPKATLPQPKLTLTESNFPRQASFTDVQHYTTQPDVAVPTEGINQLWDYSYLMSEYTETTDYFDATNDPIFTEALNFHDFERAILTFPVSTQYYEVKDEQGWYEVGKNTEEIAYPLTQLSGGPTDNIHFPPTKLFTEGRLDRVRFPMTYQKEWTQSNKQTFNFDVSIAAFGLNQVPGNVERTIIETRKVVGEGQLIIPAMDGTGASTIPMDIFLLKVERTTIDSIFLGGALAPETLLNAFGSTSVQTNSDEFYLFYKPNSGLTVCTLHFGQNKFSFQPDAVSNPCGDGIQNGDETGIDCGGSACAPCGDLCINATDLQLGTTVTGNTNLFTNNDLTDVCEQVDAPDIGVWYTFVGTGNDVTLSTDYSGTNFDTNLQVFAGECGDLVCVAADEDSGEDFVNSYTSSLTFTSVAGTTYYVYLSGFYGETGNYELSIDSTLPITISHDRTCDVPTEGQSQVTVTITGGVGPYQVSGNFNGEIEENEAFIFILDDNETSYDIIVVDSEGNESQVFETGLIPCTKLPVELLSFEGEVQTEGNLLQWATASELNNQFFTLSYSTDGQNFTPLQRIEGNGTTSSANRYEFLHRNASKGTTYYQLSQTDLDGTTKDLGTISLQRGEFSLSSIEVYPTATNNQLNISYGFADTSKSVTLNVYDLFGRIVKSQNIDSNDASLQLNVSDLAAGTYILKIENGLETLTAKFIRL